MSSYRFLGHSSVTNLNGTWVTEEDRKVQLRSLASALWSAGAAADLRLTGMVTPLRRLDPASLEHHNTFPPVPNASLRCCADLYFGLAPVKYRVAVFKVGDDPVELLMLWPDGTRWRRLSAELPEEQCLRSALALVRTYWRFSDCFQCLALFAFIPVLFVLVAIAVYGFAGGSFFVMYFAMTGDDPGKAWNLSQSNRTAFEAYAPMVCTCAFEAGISPLFPLAIVQNGDPVAVAYFLWIFSEAASPQNETEDIKELESTPVIGPMLARAENSSLARDRRMRKEWPLLGHIAQFLKPCKEVEINESVVLGTLSILMVFCVAPWIRFWSFKRHAWTDPASWPAVRPADAEREAAVRERFDARLQELDAPRLSLPRLELEAVFEVDASPLRATFAARARDLGVELCDEQSPRGDERPDEALQLLYHGTSSSAAAAIAQRGFVLPGLLSRSLMYGRGIYFAPHPQKAWQFSSPCSWRPTGLSELKRKREWRFMIASTVAVGSTLLANDSQPELDPSSFVQQRTLNGEHFHSIRALTREEGGVLNMPEYVIYQAEQALPRYVLLVSDASDDYAATDVVRSSRTRIRCWMQESIRMNWTFTATFLALVLMLMPCLTSIARGFRTLPERCRSVIRATQALQQATITAATQTDRRA